MPVPEQEPNVMADTKSDLEAILQSIQPELSRVKRRISEVLYSGDLQIDECLKAISRNPGKLLRPALVLLCGSSQGDLRNEHIDLAVMVELVHMASLLHDDVIDTGELRRGKPTANTLWGNTAAVLLGDYVLSRAFALGMTMQINGAVDLLSQTAQSLCIGELKQNLNKGFWDLTEEDYNRIIEAKTAALFQCSCRLGAIASECSSEIVEAFGAYGLHLGIAFQITDDLLDMTATQGQTGKTHGTDFLQEKFTLPIIYWLNQNSSRKTVKIEQITLKQDTKSLVSQVQQSGGFDYARRQAAIRIEAAKKALHGIPFSTEANSLYDIADYILTRIS